MIKNILPKKSGNPESLKIIIKVGKLSANVHIVGEDLLRAFYKLFYLHFYDSSDQ